MTADEHWGSEFVAKFLQPVTGVNLLLEVYYWPPWYQFLAVNAQGDSFTGSGQAGDAYSQEDDFHQRFAVDLPAGYQLSELKLELREVTASLASFSLLDLQFTLASSSTSSIPDHGGSTTLLMLGLVGVLGLRTFGSRALRMASV